MISDHEIIVQDPLYSPSAKAFDNMRSLQRREKDVTHAKIWTTNRKKSEDNLQERQHQTVCALPKDTRMGNTHLMLRSHLILRKHAAPVSRRPSASGSISPAKVPMLNELTESQSIPWEIMRIWEQIRNASIAWKTNQRYRSHFLQVIHWRTFTGRVVLLLRMVKIWRDECSL